MKSHSHCNLTYHSPGIRSPQSQSFHSIPSTVEACLASFNISPCKPADPAVAQEQLTMPGFRGLIAEREVKVCWAVISEIGVKNIPWPIICVPRYPLLQQLLVRSAWNKTKGIMATNPERAMATTQEVITIRVMDREIPDMGGPSTRVHVTLPRTR